MGNEIKFGKGMAGCRSWLGQVRLAQFFLNSRFCTFALLSWLIYYSRFCPMYCNSRFCLRTFVFRTGVFRTFDPVSQKLAHCELSRLYTVFFYYQKNQFGLNVEQFDSIISHFFFHVKFDDQKNNFFENLYFTLI